MVSSHAKVRIPVQQHWLLEEMQSKFCCKSAASYLRHMCMLHLQGGLDSRQLYQAPVPGHATDVFALLEQRSAATQSM